MYNSNQRSYLYLQYLQVHTMYMHCTYIHSMPMYLHVHMHMHRTYRRVISIKYIYMYMCNNTVYYVGIFVGLNFHDSSCPRKFDTVTFSSPRDLEHGQRVQKGPLCAWLPCLPRYMGYVWIKIITNVINLHCSNLSLCVKFRGFNFMGRSRVPTKIFYQWKFLCIR